MSCTVDVDTDLFISAVKKHDCIWNYRIQDYCDKIIKNRAWESVCTEVVKDFETKSPNEKNAIGIELQSKWKTLRDGFTRYCRNMRKKKGSAYSMKEYTYYKELLFLKTVSKNLETMSPSCPSTDEEISVNKATRKRRSDSDDEVLIEKLTKRLDDKLNRENQAETSSYLREDEDKLFLLSLLSDFKTIPDQYKLDAKGDIIQVIKNYRDMSFHI